MPEIPADYRALKGSLRLLVPGARRVAPAPQEEMLSVSVLVRRSPSAPALPEHSGVSRPLAQREFLSRSEFAARYGASQEALDRVAGFARRHGLKIVEMSAARRTVVISGTVQQISRAFAVDLNQYEGPTGRYRGREGQIHVPDNLAGIIEGVFGLDNRITARPLHRVCGSTAQAIGALTPPQVAELYNFPLAPSNLSGQTIALLELGGGFRHGDIHAFFHGLQLATPDITVVGIDGATNAPGSAVDLEVVLDIDVAGSAAPGAKVAVYFVPPTEQGWVDGVMAAIHDVINNPTVLSISWGWPEFETDAFTWTQAAMNSVSDAFQEAAAMGVTVFAASGDNGTNCHVGDGKAHVLYPASDPWVTACGGTIIETVDGPAFTEATWNNVEGATGGGISYAFALPRWQDCVHVPPSANGDGRRGRGIPDVAGHADPKRGYVPVLHGTPTAKPVGGTSAVAPLYAGLVARLNTILGKSIGHLNRDLYALAGSNVYRSVADQRSNAYEGAPGYTSTSGWNACTGFGSIDGKAFLAHFQQTINRRLRV